MDTEGSRYGIKNIDRPKGYLTVSKYENDRGKWKGEGSMRTG